jgi:extracellular factor (EF) 3-hydroxypalmitic acid methyl ester biosynthesis protein
LSITSAECAGVLDYFSDRIATSFLRRYHCAVAPGGLLVIGNFGPAHSSRAYMELVGDWHLHHRTETALRKPAAAAGISDDRVSIDREPDGVNLFLHARA